MVSGILQVLNACTFLFSLLPSPGDSARLLDRIAGSQGRAVAVTDSV